MEAPAISGPTILLRSGNYFDLQDPSASRFEVTDIAHALSNICRFTGHTKQFYSVAEHSVLCSYLVPHEDRMVALMHDAAEAFIGDVSSPLKKLLPDYKAIERRVEEHVFSTLGLPYPFPPSVKKADRIMLRLEQSQLMRNEDRWEGTEDGEGLPDGQYLRCRTPAVAMSAFMARFYELGGMK